MATTFDAIFSALDSTEVRYVIVGGIAVNLHGYQRFTKDVDVVIELIPEQTLKAMEALQAIGYTPRLPINIADFANPAIRETWVREKGMMVFQLYNDAIHQTIDVFADYPLDFDALWRDSVAVTLNASSPRIASIDHLIEMKQRAARPQDMADIDMLKKLKLLLAGRNNP